MPLRQSLGRRNLFLIDAETLELIDSRDHVAAIQDLYLEEDEMTVLVLSDRRVNSVVHKIRQGFDTLSPRRELWQVAIEGEEPTGGYWTGSYYTNAVGTTLRHTGQVPIDEDTTDALEVLRPELSIDGTAIQNGPSGVMYPENDSRKINFRSHGLLPKWTICRYDSGLTPMERVDLGNTTDSIARIGDYYYATCQDVLPAIATGGPGIAFNQYGGQASDLPTAFIASVTKPGLLYFYTPEDRVQGNVDAQYIPVEKASGTYSVVVNRSNIDEYEFPQIDATTNLDGTIMLRNIPVPFHNGYNAGIASAALDYPVQRSTDLTKSIWISPPIAQGGTYYTTSGLYGGAINKIQPKHNIVKLRADDLSIVAKGNWDTKVAFRQASNQLVATVSVVAANNNLIILNKNMQEVAWKGVKASVMAKRTLYDGIDFIVSTYIVIAEAAGMGYYTWDFDQPETVFTGLQLVITVGVVGSSPRRSQPRTLVQLSTPEGVKECMATIPGITDADMVILPDKKIKFVNNLASTNMNQFNWVYANPDDIQLVLTRDGDHPFDPDGSLGFIPYTLEDFIGGYYWMYYPTDLRTWQVGGPKPFGGTRYETEMVDGFDIYCDPDLTGTYRIRSCDFWGHRLSISSKPGAKTAWAYSTDGATGANTFQIKVRYKETWSDEFSTSTDPYRPDLEFGVVLAQTLTTLTGSTWSFIRQPITFGYIDMVYTNDAVYSLADFELDCGYRYSDPLPLTASSSDIKEALEGLGYIDVEMMTNWPVTQCQVRWNYQNPVWRSNIAIDVSGLGQQVALGVILNTDMLTTKVIPGNRRYPATFKERDLPAATIDTIPLTLNQQKETLYRTTEKHFVNAFGEIFTDGLIKYDSDMNILAELPNIGTIRYLDRFNDIYVTATVYNPTTGVTTIDGYNVYDRYLVFQRKITIPRTAENLFNANNKLFVDRHHHIYALGTSSIQKYDQSGNLLKTMFYSYGFVMNFTHITGTKDGRLIVASRRDATTVNSLGKHTGVTY